MVNSREKGNSAEREIAKMLREAFNGEAFSRRSMGQKGHDIFCPEWFSYSPEVKHDKAVKTRHFFEPNKLLLRYWQQAVDQSATGKLPVLFAKVEGSWYAITRMVTGFCFTNGMAAVWNGEAVFIEPIAHFIDRYRKERNGISIDR